MSHGTGRARAAVGRPNASESHGRLPGARGALQGGVTRTALAALVLGLVAFAPGCDAADLLDFNSGAVKAPASANAAPDQDANPTTTASTMTPASSNPTMSNPAAAAVVINGQVLDASTMASLQAGGVQPPAGRFWYDAYCGAWGYEGQGTAGFVQAGLAIGGPLSPKASAGNTGVFINGRELPTADLTALQRLGPVPQGRYWLDGQGNWGVEGGPVQGNLVAAARQAGGGNSGGGSGDNYYHSDNTGVSMNSSGGSGYIMGDGWSVSW